ncbi:uncharacterized protein LOC144175346 [Haemaphysalis longicornis]
MTDTSSSNGSQDDVENVFTELDSSVRLELSQVADYFEGVFPHWNGPIKMGDRFKQAAINAKLTERLKTLVRECNRNASQRFLKGVDETFCSNDLEKLITTSLYLFSPV